MRSNQSQLFFQPDVKQSSPPSPLTAARALLKVSPHASLADLKTAYRKAALQYHPDKNAFKDTTSQFQEIQKAYALLTEHLEAHQISTVSNNMSRFVTSKNSFAELPVELVTAIFFYLTPNELAIISLVSVLFKEITHNNKFIHDRYTQRFSYLFRDVPADTSINPLQTLLWHYDPDIYYSLIPFFNELTQVAMAFDAHEAEMLVLGYNPRKPLSLIHQSAQDILHGLLDKETIKESCQLFNKLEVKRLYIGSLIHLTKILFINNGFQNSLLPKGIIDSVMGLINRHTKPNEHHPLSKNRCFNFFELCHRELKNPIFNIAFQQLEKLAQKYRSKASSTTQMIEGWSYWYSGQQPDPFRILQRRNDIGWAQQKAEPLFIFHPLGPR